MQYNKNEECKPKIQIHLFLDKVSVQPHRVIYNINHHFIYIITIIGIILVFLIVDFMKNFTYISTPLICFYYIGNNSYISNMSYMRINHMDIIRI